MIEGPGLTNGDRSKTNSATDGDQSPSVRGMQVPCRYPDYRWWSEPSVTDGDQSPLLFVSWPAQGYGGTLQVFWRVSGVCRYLAGILTSARGTQAPCRYPDQCLRYAGTLQVSWLVPRVCRYPAGILTIVRGMKKLASRVLEFSRVFYRGYLEVFRRKIASDIVYIVPTRYSINQV